LFLRGTGINSGLTAALRPIIEKVWGNLNQLKNAGGIAELAPYSLVVAGNLEVATFPGVGPGRAVQPAFLATNPIRS
jgi:hypothetical protein